MTLVDRDPAELLAGLTAPLPPGSGPDLDAVIAGGRRRRRRGRVRTAAGTACLVAVLGVSGAVLAPALTGGPDAPPPPAAQRGGDRADGRTSWAAAARPPGRIGVLAQEEIDAVLSGAQADGGGPLGPVRWSSAHGTAPGVRDGEALVAPSSSGGEPGVPGRPGPRHRLRRAPRRRRGHRGLVVRRALHPGGLDRGRRGGAEG